MTSDQLPFVQVALEARQRIDQLATLTGLTPQHVCGALAFWWASFERREIEGVIERGAREIILDGERLRRQMRHHGLPGVEPEDLEEACFIERTGDGKFRVRGMSRYIDATVKIQNHRALSVAGGKASAASRGVGHSAPKRRRGSTAGSTGGSTAGSTGGQPPSNQEVKRLKVTPLLATLVTGADVVGPAPESTEQDSGFRVLVDDLVGAFEHATGAKYAFGGSRDGRAVRELLGHERLEVLRRWRLALASEAYPRVRTIHELAERWNHFAADAKQSKPQNLAPSPVPDWRDKPIGEVAWPEPAT